MLVVVQYAKRFNEEKLKRWLYDTNSGLIARKRFKVRLAQADDSLRLTGYKTGGVTPIALATADLPVVLSASVAQLQPQLFWLGAADVDLKARVRTLLATAHDPRCCV
jgi:prolyl-tRNA editing enzyme YbaK/EbsC (Cys-tRNA(Pro) deacylase)